MGWGEDVRRAEVGTGHSLGFEGGLLLQTWFEIKRQSSLSRAIAEEFFPYCLFGRVCWISRCCFEFKFFSGVQCWFIPVRFFLGYLAIVWFFLVLRLILSVLFMGDLVLWKLAVLVFKEVDGGFFPCPAPIDAASLHESLQAALVT